jgi:hypothetical protein
VFKEACRCLRKCLFLCSSETHKKHFERTGRMHEGDVKNCSKVKN